MRSFVMNDYIHVDERTDLDIWFEPLRPLCVLNTIVGSLWAAGDLLFRFLVIRQQGTPLYQQYPLYQQGTQDVIGVVWPDNRILLISADTYPEDIYLCLSYELDGGDDGEPELNWKKEGF